MTAFPCGQREALGRPRKKLFRDPSDDTKGGPPPPHLHNKAQHSTGLFFFEKRLGKSGFRPCKESSFESLALCTNSVLTLLGTGELRSSSRFPSYWSHCLDTEVSVPAWLPMVTDSQKTFYPSAHPLGLPTTQERNCSQIPSREGPPHFHRSARTRLPAVSMPPNVPGTPVRASFVKWTSRTRDAFETVHLSFFSF